MQNDNYKHPIRPGFKPDAIKEENSHPIIGICKPKKYI